MLASIFISMLYGQMRFSIFRTDDAVYGFNAGDHNCMQQTVRSWGNSPDASVVTGGATVGERSQNQVGLTNTIHGAWQHPK